MKELRWDFPSVEPPSYLLELNPSLYEQEKQRMAMRFEEAVAMAGQAFTEEFGKLIGHVTERLSGVGEDGQPKTFRNSCIENLHEFFERFRTLNVHSSKELDDLVDTAQRALGNTGPQKLREDGDLRQRIRFAGGGGREGSKWGLVGAIGICCNGARIREFACTSRPAVHVCLPVPEVQIEAILRRFNDLNYPELFHPINKPLVSKGL